VTQRTRSTIQESNASITGDGNCRYVQNTTEALSARRPAAVRFDGVSHPLLLAVPTHSTHNGDAFSLTSYQHTASSIYFSLTAADL
jgi:hypothetical protein